ncbi:hypothetical protein EV363DRAFT_1258546 [Boletus edulis]|nr:hypothetical protein EV363DRAFT_1258546 [Boletus edulis]
MMTLPLQSVNAESGENSSPNSPGQRSQEKYRVLALEGFCFSVIDSVVAFDRFYYFSVFFFLVFV